MSAKIVNQYLRNLTPLQTFAGCVRTFDTVWNDGDKTVEFLNSEASNENLPIYWVKEDTLNYLELKNNYKASGNFTFTHFYNDVSYITLSGAQQYFNEFYPKDINISNIKLVRIKPNTNIEAYPLIGNLTAFIFLNKDSGSSVMEFNNFGVSLNPEYNGMLFTPSSFPYKISVKTENDPLYFFHVTVE